MHTMLSIQNYHPSIVHLRASGTARVFESILNHSPNVDIDNCPTPHKTVRYRTTIHSFPASVHLSTTSYIPVQDLG